MNWLKKIRIFNTQSDCHNLFRVIRWAWSVEFLHFCHYWISSKEPQKNNFWKAGKGNSKKDFTKNNWRHTEISESDAGDYEVEKSDTNKKRPINSKFVQGCLVLSGWAVKWSSGTRIALVSPRILLDYLMLENPLWKIHIHFLVKNNPVLWDLLHFLILDYGLPTRSRPRKKIRHMSLYFKSKQVGITYFRFKYWSVGLSDLWSLYASNGHLWDQIKDQKLFDVFLANELFDKYIDICYKQRKKENGRWTDLDIDEVLHFTFWVFYYPWEYMKYMILNCCNGPAIWVLSCMNFWKIIAQCLFEEVLNCL